MKAVIVEIKGNLAAVLSDDGSIRTIKDNNYAIGQVIHLNQPKRQIPKKLVTFAASAAAFVVLGVGGWAYATPYTYVSLDVNPSIEYTLNRFERVLSVKAVNDDGEKIINNLDLDELYHNTIQKALTKTVEKITEAGYFNETTEGTIVIATSGKDPEDAEALAEELEQEIADEVEEEGNEIAVEAISVDLERVEQAKNLGVTPGKLNLVEKLQEAAKDTEVIDLEDWLSKPVKDIMKATKEYKEAASKNSENTSEDPVTDLTEQESDKAAKQQDKDKADKAADKSKDKAEKEKDKVDKKEDKAANKSDKAEDKADKANEKTNDKAGKSSGMDKNEQDIVDSNTNNSESDSNSETSEDIEDSKSNNSQEKNKNNSSTDKQNKGDIQNENKSGDPSSNNGTDKQNSKKPKGNN